MGAKKLLIQLHCNSILKRLMQNYTPRWIIFTIDLVIVALAFVSLWLFKEDIAAEKGVLFEYKLLLTVALYATTALIFNTHRGIIRYSAAHDLKRIFASAFVATLLYAGVCIFFNYTNYWDNILPNFNIWFPFLLFFMVVSGQFLFRFVVKTMFDLIEGIYSSKKIRVFILGADSDSIRLANFIIGEKNNPYKPVAFISLDHNLAGKSVCDLPILPVNGGLTDYMTDYKVNTMLIYESELELVPKELYDRCIVEGLELLLVNSFSKVNNKADEDTTPEIKKIKIEDLLGRNPIEMNKDAIENQFIDQCVLITGAAGSIGSEIARQVLQFNCKQIVLVDQAESPLNDLWLELKAKDTNVEIKPIVANVSNEKRMRLIFDCAKPDLVFHAAAYKHVPMMEFYPSTAVIANVLGTKVVADLSLEFGVKRFVMISTDKAVNPTSVMGATKRVAEIYVQSLYFKQLEEDRRRLTRFVTTRFGNVLGSNGSVVHLFKRQIEAGGPITVTHRDIVRYFMTIPEACNLVLEAGCIGNGGEIYIFDMGQAIKIYDLAEKMIRLSGKVPGKDIKIVEIGLRPGEKLYEELLANSENALPTYNKKLMIAMVRQYSFKKMLPEIEDLIELAHEYSRPTEVVAKLKLLVPEFKSQNSKYVELDVEFENK